MYSGSALFPARQRDESAERLVERLMALTGIGPADHVTVAGRSILPVFLELCGRNFLHACCMTGAGPHLADDGTDSLWLLNVRTEAELLVLAEKLGRHLRPNGTLVVSLSSLGSAAFPFRLRHLLLEHGFAAAHQSAVLIGGDLYLVARKGIPFRTKAAA